MNSPLLHFSLLFALLDLGTRELSRNFEWFEFHLTILSPLLFFFIPSALLYGLILKPLLPKRFLELLLSSLTLLLLSVFFLGDIQRSDVALPQFSISLTTFSLLAGALGIDLLLALTSRLSLSALFVKAYQSSKRYLSLPVQFLLLMTLSALCFDLYELKFSGDVAAKESSKKTSLLFIVLDTVRKDSFDKHSGKYRAEFREAFSEFSSTRSPSPWTLPAHASLFTGLYPEQHKATLRYQKLDDEFTTLAELFSKAGYNTGLFTANAYLKAKFGMAQGFALRSDRIDFFEHKFTSEVFSYRMLLRMLYPPLERWLYKYDAERTAEEVLAELAPFIQQQRPYFAFVNLYDAHDPYLPKQRPDSITYPEARKLDRKLKKLMDWRTQYKWKTSPEDISEEELSKIQALYEQEVKELSETVLSFLKLKKEALENTVVVISSDHGEEFLEHGGMGHAAVLYEESIAVPLVIIDPDLERSYDTGRNSSLLDLFPTLIERFDLERSPSSGHSLLNELPGYKTEAQLFGREKFGEPKSHRAVIIKNEKLITTDPDKARIIEGSYLIEKGKEVLQDTSGASTIP